MIEIKTLEISGMASVLQALHLPFGKECRSKCDSQFSIDKSELIVHSESTSVVSPKDLTLLSTLVKRGDEHSKVIRGLLVYAEIEAPVYWWCEMETYRAGHERLSSQSTMHIDARGLNGDALVELKRNIPMGKVLKKVDFFSYQCLRNIVKQRTNHRLPEWATFIDWVKSLPFAKELILTGLEDE